MIRETACDRFLRRRRRMSWLERKVRILIGWHNIHDFTTCYLSCFGRDLHDYPESRGGDGTPSHFHTYTCPECKQEFII